MDVGFKYRESGKLPNVKVPGTFYYLAKSEDKDEQLWFCFSDTLIKRVDNELLNADEVNAVIKEYLEKNGISLDGYATEKWVEDILKKYATKTDLGGYTTKKELETKLGNYAKTEVLDSYATKTDLGGYTTKKELDTKLGNYAKKDDLNGYATEKWVEDKDYAIKTELGDYATKTDLDKYAKKDDLGSYATKTELGDYAKTEVLEGYVKKEDAAKKSVWEELTLSD